MKVTQEGFIFGLLGVIALLFLAYYLGYRAGVHAEIACITSLGANCGG